MQAPPADAEPARRAAATRVTRWLRSREAQLVYGLLDLAHGLASDEPLAQRLTRLCRITTEQLRCDRSSVFLLEDGRYRAKWNHGNPQDVAARFPHFSVGLRDPLIAKAMHTRSFVLVNDAARSPLMDQRTAKRARIGSIVAAPLFDEHAAPLGFLTAEYNENPGRFSETMSALVLGLAKLAQIAVIAETRRVAGRRAEEERARLERALRQSQRLEALGRLAAAVAHDFNNLLTVIAGYADSLDGQLADRASLREEVQEIARVVDRASALTRQLLAFGRGQVMQPRVIALGGVLGRLDEMLRRLVPENVELRIHVAADLAPVKADPTQIEQVVVNLVANARDAMPQGGTITIEASNRELAAGKLPGRPEIEPGPWVELSVSDTGVGMDDVTQAHVFEPFFSTKPEGLGSGLGLATVHGIVRQSAGHVVIESRPGGGSTFRVLLRPTRESAEQPAETAPRLARGVGGGETILLAEDEEQVRRLMTRALEEQGYIVLAAPDGERAAEIAARHEGRIELLVSDVVMPGLSGRELAEWLRARRPELRVLFVSGYAREPHTQLDPSEAYLPKPFSSDALLRTVREVLDTAPGL